MYHLVNSRKPFCRLNSNDDIHSTTRLGSSQLALDPSHTVHLQGPPRAIYTFAPLGLQILAENTAPQSFLQELSCLQSPLQRCCIREVPKRDCDPPQMWKKQNHLSSDWDVVWRRVAIWTDISYSYQLHEFLHFLKYSIFSVCANCQIVTFWPQD